MPARNYCRDALVQHCLEAKNFDEAKAETLLRKVVTERRDFLVRFACVPVGGKRKQMTSHDYTLRRFDAKKWIQNHAVSESYFELLCRAYLLTPGLEIPREVWTPDLKEVFREITMKVMQQRSIPQRHNFDIVRNSEDAGPIFSECEEDYPDDFLRFRGKYDRLVHILNQGLPPPHRVTDPEYPGLVERAQNLEVSDVEIDAAITLGEGRRWREAGVQRVTSLLDLYVTGHLRGMTIYEIGELFYESRPEQSLREHNQVLVEAARSLQFWRIRRNEAQEWKRALPPRLWTMYQECELKMHSLESGVYSKIPRRRFNQASLKHMVEKNLGCMCLALGVAGNEF